LAGVLDVAAMSPAVAFGGSGQLAYLVAGRMTCDDRYRYIGAYPHLHESRYRVGRFHRAGAGHHDPRDWAASLMTASR
jgi:hypothetical protein